MGEIRPKKCEGSELTKDQLADRRAAFDDFGVATDMSSEQAGAGFETWEEYRPLL